MRLVAIFSRYYPGTDYQYLIEMLRRLETEGFRLAVEHNFATHLKTLWQPGQPWKIFQGYKDLPRETELFITYGGDGTILRAATIVRDSGIPLMGINAGRLGFLADIPKESITMALDKYLAGAYYVQPRSLLAVETTPEMPKIKELNFALNELTVTRKNSTSMISVEVSVNGEFLSTYWADGLIVSTPTGSTGYSLSCGGPILTPDTRGMIINAIAPHNLTVRPLVLPDHYEINLVPDGREKEFLLSLDSRVASIPFGTRITVKRAGFKMNFIRLEEYTFIRTLRRKLFWGYDNRNT